MDKPLCFVVMPFGIKRDTEGGEVDFDVVYRDFIKPAIEAADLEPIRADEETISGIIHKPMYERLILCDYAVADLTTTNANVFYELGIRHAVKPFTTITVFSSDSKLPFDVNFLRSMPYEYDESKQLTNIDDNVKTLTKKLLEAKREKTTDSPVFQLVDGIAFQDGVAHEKTDIFRDRVMYNEQTKKKLAEIRRKKTSAADRVEELDAFVKSLILENEETGVLINIMLSYRALGAYDKMIAYIDSMPFHVQQTVMVKEQLGFALNRVKKREEALKVLKKVVEEHGPSSETYGIMGRVYKDLFDEALKDNNEALAGGYLDKTLETYLKGFEADWRDAYPGVNALTMLELKGDRKKIQQLAPVVEYAVVRKLPTKEAEYWDYATLLEIAVIKNDKDKASSYFKKALTCSIEGEWMFNTTINNIRLIQTYRTKRKENSQLPEEVLSLLREQKKKLAV